jgi:hypothetical protein
MTRHFNTELQRYAERSIRRFGHYSQYDKPCSISTPEKAEKAARIEALLIRLRKNHHQAETNKSHPQ